MIMFENCLLWLMNTWIICQIILACYNLDLEFKNYAEIIVGIYYTPDW